MAKSKIFMKPKNLKAVTLLGDWTPEKLRKERLALNLTLRDIAEVLGVSDVTIGNIERGVKSDPFAIQIYGIILERYYAALHGYVPAYRKVGENVFMEDENGLRTVQ